MTLAYQMQDAFNTLMEKELTAAYVEGWKRASSYHDFNAPDVSELRDRFMEASLYAQSKVYGGTN